MFRKVIMAIIIALLVWPLAACSHPAATIRPAASTTPVEPVEIDSQENFNLFNGKTIAAIALINPAAENQKIVEDFFQNTLNLPLKYRALVYVDSLTDGLLMLRSHKADALHLMRFTGNYLVQRSQDLKQYIVADGLFTTEMIFSPRNQAQCEKIDSALRSMMNDGTLGKLIDEWITNLPVGEEPSGARMPVIKGAETLRMGISGDEPPLDYIAADGQPGGFNVAVLSEISRRANLNFDLVTVVSGARFAAMQSGKIDGFLWHNTLKGVPGLPDEEISHAKLGDPDYVYRTVSYLDDKESLVVLK